MDDFIRHIEAEFEDVKPGTLSPETNFRKEFEWNSINALVMIGMVDLEYGVTLNADDLRKSATISDLFNIIKSKQ